jgi:hypothetical protein
MVNPLRWFGRKAVDTLATVALAAGSYRAVNDPRSRTRIWADGTGDYHLDAHTQRELRTKSRDLERNSHLYDGFLSNWAVYLIGSGPKPLPRSTNAAWAAQASALFAADAAAGLLDSRRLLAWPLWLAHLARSVVRDGDAGVWHEGDGSAAILEGDRLGTVTCDDRGRIVSIGVLAPDQGWFSAPQQSVAAQTLQLVAWRTRPSQTRGHPALAAGLDDWERIDSLNEAEILTAEAASLPWMVVKRQPGAPAGGPVAGPGAAAGPGGRALPTGWQRSDAANLFVMPQGYDGQAWAPDRPNLNVPAFVIQQLRHLCLPLLPYEIAFLDVGSLNYAAIRGLGRLARRRLTDFRGLYLLPVINRVWSDWARAQILAKRLPAVADFAAVDWQWDELEIRDREKDATAVERELANGTTTLQGELGPDWQRTVEQTAREERAAHAAAVANILALHQACVAANAANPGLDLRWSQIAAIGGATTAPGAFLQGTAAPAAPTADPVTP